MATVKPAIHGKSVEAGTPENIGTQSGLVFDRFFTDGKNCDSTQSNGRSAQR